MIDATPTPPTPPAFAPKWEGTRPWMKLSTALPEGATVEEMLSAAKLDWGIALKPLCYVTEREGGIYTKTEVPRNAMIREDTGQLLDVVGPKYIPAQNNEVLEFFREYLAVGDMALDTAGSLWGGRYVWGLARLRQGFTLPGGDEINGHVLVANANKYGRGLIVKLVTVRDVCWNTLSVALGNSGDTVSIAHNKQFDEAGRASAKAKLGIATDAFASLKKEAETFSEIQLDVPAVNRVLSATFKLPVEDDGMVFKDSRAAARVRQLFEGAGEGATMVSAAGTAWGLLNAVTQYVDHETGRSNDTRLRNAWFGGGETTKKRARKALWTEASK